MAEPLPFILDEEDGWISEELRNEITHVVIGPRVTEIKPLTFLSYTALRSVIVPATVIKIGEVAFLDCKNLTQVRLHEGMEVIGDNAFFGCKALRSVTIPSSVTELGKAAFDSCINLADVEFKEVLKVIGEQAFAGAPRCEA